MFKRCLAVAAMLFASAACAGVDVNQASEADLDGMLGIGPALSARILEQRRSGAFQDWADLRARVKGLGRANAAKLSAQGLTVDGMPFQASGVARSSAPKKAPQE